MSAVKSNQNHRRGRLAGLVTLTLTLAALTAQAPAVSAAVEWDPTVVVAPTHLPPGGQGGVRVQIANVGTSASASWPAATIELPTGVSLDPSFTSAFECTGVATIVCSSPFGGFFSAPPNTYLFGGGVTDLYFRVNVDSGAPTGAQPMSVTLSGGGAASPTTEVEQVTVAADQLPFGAVPGSFEAGAFDESGDDYTQAGGHPYDASTSFRFNTKLIDGTIPVIAKGWLKDVVADLPPGFVGDPTAVPKCANAHLVAVGDCPASSQVGVATYDQPTLPEYAMSGVYNIVPKGDSPAQLAFLSPAGPAVLTPFLRGDGSWALSVKVQNNTEASSLYGTGVTLWGIPADPSHDSERCATPNLVARACVGYDPTGREVGSLGGVLTAANGQPSSSSAPRNAFLTNPTSCTGEPVETVLHLAQWEDPAPYLPNGDPDLSSPKWANATATAPAVTGCAALEFEPTLKARPTTNVADSPTGLEVDLHIPQNEDPDGLATAHLKDTTVTLPEGLTINASGANGLGGCSPAQIGLTSKNPIRFDKDDPGDGKGQDCPLSSTVGTVEVETPLLEDPLEGAVFVATPHDNPFGSLLALYIVVRGPGIVVKLAGEVTPDPQTGRIAATFDDNPQLPFEHFRLDFFGGASASLQTPATCGTYSTTSELTPWSAPDTGPPATPKDTYAISQGPNGQGCASSEGALPNTPSFEAGSTNPLAGAHSPFVLKLRREDGSQRFSALNVNPPPGLVAKLAGTAICPDSALAAAAAKSGNEEKSSPSCPAASEVGDVYAQAGAGPAPYNAPGKAYLSGPYKGAPLSFAFITPATAGPFDLGTIVVRAAVYVNSKTAEVSAISDSLPTILEGIPLDVRSVDVRIDKPEFMLNPTSCDPTAVNGQALSTVGQTASLTSRFQLGECGRLGLKPKLSLRLKGATKRGKNPALTAILEPRAGDANLASVSVALPRSEFLDQAHIRTVCTRVQFAADACPEAAIYGQATVYTPLLDYPLTGPVYLRSSDNELPDLVPDLRGPAYQPIRLEASGRTDSIKGGIRNTFDFVPDAPFTKFVLQMQGGKKGLLENSTNICRDTFRATVKYGAHNGLTAEARPVLKAKCAKAKRKKHGKR